MAQAMEEAAVEQARLNHAIEERETLIEDLRLARFWSLKLSLFMKCFVHFCVLCVPSFSLAPAQMHMNLHMSTPLPATCMRVLLTPSTLFFTLPFPHLFFLRAVMPHNLPPEQVWQLLVHP